MTEKASLSDYLYYHEDGPPVIDIYCGDCLEIMPLLPKVDLVVTDPPYKELDYGWEQNVLIVYGLIVVLLIMAAEKKCLGG